MSLTYVKFHTELEIRMDTVELITEFTPAKPTRQEIITRVEDLDERQIALHYYSYEKSPVRS